MAQSKQKRPEPAVSAQGEQNCPWFHLNSCLADTHFVPGNGGGRRAISCPRSRVPSRPALGGFAPAILSLAPRRGVLFSVSALSDIVIYKTQVVKGCFSARSRRKSQAKNAVLFQQTILRYFVHFGQHKKATRQSPAGSLCFIVLFPCYFRVLCVRFSLKYERTGAARPPSPSTRPAPCSHSARLKPSLGSCSSRFGFA